MKQGKMKKVLSLLLAFAMVVTGSNATFRTVDAAETSDTAGKSLPLSEEDGYKAYLMFADENWNWGNWAPQSEEDGWGNDAVITGDGTYTVSIDRKSYEEYLQAQAATGTAITPVSSAQGAVVLLVNFQEMSKAENFDISDMKVKNVTVKCDGKVFPTNTNNMYFGNIRDSKTDELNLEICNAYGYNGGDFETKNKFDPDLEFAFSDSLSVTFTLEGIKEGSTPESLFYDSYGESIIRTMAEWNNDPSETPIPHRTGKPTKKLPLSEKDGYTAYLMFTDQNWNWGNWAPNGTIVSSYKGWGNDTVITGDGTYTVSIDRKSYEEYLQAQAATNGAVSAEPVDGVNCFMVDFQGMATAQNFDISNMKVKDVTVKCDGKVFDTDESKMYFGDIESKNNLRLEIRNEYGYGEGIFATKDVFDPSDRFGFTDELSVTFTLEGIQKGNTMREVFYKRSAPIIRTLDNWNARSLNTAEPTESPAQIASLPAVSTPTDAPTAPPATEPPVFVTPVRPLITPAATSRPSSGGTETTKSPNATRKPRNTAKPSKSPSEQTTETVTPTTSARPTETAAPRITRLPESTMNVTLKPKTTLPPDNMSTEEPGNSEETQPPMDEASSAPVTTPAPDGQTTAVPAATTVPQITVAPVVKATAEPQEYGEPADEGEELEDKSGTTYTVTQSGKKAEVEYSAPKENAKGTVKIPDKVTINGVSYKVTSVADNAFKNNDKVKEVVLNKNITSIGKNVFSGCKNLKTITITSTKLTSKSISQNAFKGISGKVVIKVPKGMKKKYKKLFRSKGLSKKVRFI